MTPAPRRMRRVIQHTQPESLPRFVEPAQVVVSITGEPEEKVSLVAAMRQMPDMAGQKMAVGTRHRFAPLKRAFCYRKDASRRWNRAYITDLHLWIKALWWSDPYLAYSLGLALHFRSPGQARPRRTCLRLAPVG